MFHTCSSREKGARFQEGISEHGLKNAPVLNEKLVFQTPEQASPKSNREQPSERICPNVVPSTCCCAEGSRNVTPTHGAGSRGWQIVQMVPFFISVYQALLIDPETEKRENIHRSHVFGGRRVQLSFNRVRTSDKPS